MELKKISKNNKMWSDFLKIYDDVFEDHEKESIEKIEDNVKDGLNEVFVAIKDDKVVGFNILANSSNDNFSLLWYLGVAKNQQGLGTGSKILNLIIEDFKNNSEQPRLILEAEPQQAKWYTKNGFLKFDHDYKYPSFVDDSMSNTSLMTIEKDNLKNIKMDTFKNVLKDLYVGVYAKTTSDNKIAKEIDGIKKDIKIKKMKNNIIKKTC